MEKKEYTHYLFDLYGTLVNIHTDEEQTLLWEKLSLFYGFYGASYTAEELRASYLEEVTASKKTMAATISHEAYPEIQLEYVFQKLFAYKGVTVDLEQSIYTGQLFRILSTEYIRLYEGAKELLQALKQAGKKVYLLSDAQNIFTRYEMKYLGIDTLFDDIFISSDYGCKKPDAAFYNQVISKYHLEDKNVMMIGNDYHCDILGAQAVGLDTFYIYSNLSPTSDLEEKIESTYALNGMDLNKVKTILIEA